MKVSIIITSYNRPDTIGWTIESALRQTYPDTEIVVVDAGTNKEANHIGRTKAYRNFVQRQPGGLIEFIPPVDGNKNLGYIEIKNTGAEDARNLGVNGVARRFISGGDEVVEPLCSGEILLFLDDDDWIESNFLEKTVPLMTPGIGIVSTDMHVFSNTTDSVVQTETATLERMKEKNGIPFSSLIYRDAFEQTAGFERKVYDDWNLWISILKRGWKHAIVHEPLFHYRYNLGPSLISEVKKSHETRIANMALLHPEIYGKS